MRVQWTNSAKEDLEDIFSYYTFVASEKVAKSITKRIVKRSIDLKSNPFIGVKEELITDKSKQYRYLVVDNYKIIYFIVDDLVVISTVFDSRQNPAKLIGFSDIN